MGYKLAKIRIIYFPPPSPVILFFQGGKCLLKVDNLFIADMMCSPILLIIAIFAIFEKVLTSSIPDDDLPLQALDEPTNGYDSARLEFFSADTDLTESKSISSSPSSGSDDVNIPPNVDVDDLTAAAEHSSSTLMMLDSTPHNPTAKYPEPVCIISFWPLCCHGKLYDKYGKISECFDCMILFLFSLLACLLE